MTTTAGGISIRSDADEKMPTLLVFASPLRCALVGGMFTKQLKECDAPYIWCEPLANNTSGVKKITSDAGLNYFHSESFLNTSSTMSGPKPCGAYQIEKNSNQRVTNLLAGNMNHQKDPVQSASPSSGERVLNASTIFFSACPWPTELMNHFMGGCASDHSSRRPRKVQRWVVRLPLLWEDTRLGILAEGRHDQQEEAPGKHMTCSICRDEQPRQRIKPAPKRAKTHIHAGSPSNKASAIGRRGPVDIDAGGKMVVSDEPARAIAITTGRRLMFFFRYKALDALYRAPACVYFPTTEGADVVELLPWFWIVLDKYSGGQAQSCNAYKCKGAWASQ
ncbi:hypothetical protein CPB85DRAFT_1540844 [Mucidula mucida]|nr:hypothetical protein CPB85DRAFT_1540844 [Mucidula mucida]